MTELEEKNLDMQVSVLLASNNHLKKHHIYLNRRYAMAISPREREDFRRATQQYQWLLEDIAQSLDVPDRMVRAMGVVKGLTLAGYVKDRCLYIHHNDAD